jgi:hypothetical protein
VRQALPALAAGSLAALALYGLLAAFGGRGAAERDPWMEAWEAAGLQAVRGIVSKQPSKDLLFVEGRALFERPEAAGASLREYQLDGMRAQVVELPSPAALGDFPEGKHADFRLRPKGGSVHLCRRGRQLLFLSIRQGTAMFRSIVERVSVKKAFDAFAPEGGPP